MQPVPDQSALLCCLLDGCTMIMSCPATHPLLLSTAPTLLAPPPTPVLLFPLYPFIPPN
jgi:hypothetical protein